MNRFLTCLFAIFILCLGDNVYADVCDSADMQRLKELSKSITADYNYLGDAEHDGNYQLYEVSFDFGELSGDVYIGTGVSSEEEAFVYNSGEKLRVDSGEQKFRVYSTYCADIQVGTVTVNLPKFNVYSIEGFCNGLGNVLEVCNEWYQGKLSDGMVQSAIDNYFASTVDDTFDISRFISTYYLALIIGGVVIIIVAVLLLIKVRRDNKLD